MGAFMCEQREKPPKTGDNFLKKRGRNTHKIAKLLGNVFLTISGTRVIDSDSLSKLELSLLDKQESCGRRALVLIKGLERNS